MHFNISVEGLCVVYCRHLLPSFKFAVEISQDVCASPLAPTDVLYCINACTVLG